MLMFLNYFLYLCTKKNKVVSFRKIQFSKVFTAFGELWL